MRTDLAPIETDFVPDYAGWENDFDERCNRQSHITVSLRAPELPAGIERTIKERASKNGMRLMVNSARKKPRKLVFQKAAPMSSH